MKRPSIDQGAQASGAILIILGVFDVASKLGITAADLAELVGAFMLLGGIWRHRHEKKKVSADA